MKPLPRPVRQVLDDSSNAASVMRVWARVQVERRAPPRLARPWLAGIPTAAALVMVVAMKFRSPPASTVSQASMGEGAALKTRSVQKGAEQTLPSTLLAEPARIGPWLQGRHSLSTFGRRSGVRAESPSDVVGSLLASAEDAWQEGQPLRVVALLGEVSEHHADDPRACEALFLLGLVQLDVLKHPLLAKASFQRALELDPPEDLIAPLWEGYQRSTSAEGAE
jgi:hypothetical protein